MTWSLRTAFAILTIMLHAIPVLGAILGLLVSLALGLGSFLLWLFIGSIIFVHFKFVEKLENEKRQERSSGIWRT